MRKIIQFFKAVCFVYQHGRDRLFCDQLTGLYNRSLLGEFAQKEIEQARRYHKDLSIVFIDLDGLKKINDNQGHQEGDRIIKEVAKILVSYSRKADLIFRWGGDEFLMLLPYTIEKDAERLIMRISRQLQNQGVSISYGVVPWSKRLASFEDFLSEADKRLYRHKRKKQTEKGA